MNNQFHTQRLRQEEEHILTPEDEKAIKDMAQAAANAIVAGLISVDDVKTIIQKLNQDEQVDEDGSVSSGAGAYLPGLDVPEKKYKTGYTEEKDVEPKLAAGNAKVYAHDKWGWEYAPSIPNRPSKGGFIYKQLFEAKTYSQFKREVSTRPNEDALREALKSIYKRLHEIDRLAEYSSDMKREIGEDKQGSRTSQVVRKLEIKLAEIYKKVKSWK